jgi:manganese-dependent ADP-ribose/CDP-alcohol diphosphatase
MRRRDFVRGAAGWVLAGTAEAAETAPSFRVGAVTDVHFADKADEPPRYFRASPAKLRQAVTDFRQSGVDFAVHLGDFTDSGWDSFDAIRPVAAALPVPWHFALGNMDFSVPSDRKREFAARLGMPARYYSFEHKDWLFVALDGNDISVHGWPDASPEQNAAQAFHDEKFPAGKIWNGAIGPEQMRWLDDTLAAAGQHKVAILCHFPLVGSENTVLWNASEVLAHIEPHRCVKLWLNGHDHDGGYALRAGIHHLNLKGTVNTKEPAYAVLSFYRERIEVAGYGREPSRTLALRVG